MKPTNRRFLKAIFFRTASAAYLFSAVLLIELATPAISCAEAASDDETHNPLKQLTLEQLGDVEVTDKWGGGGLSSRKTPQFALVGSNLFQPYHYEYASYPAPNVAVKRSAYAEITWQK